MDNAEDLLRKAANDKRRQESSKKLKDGSKDDFFGIWADYEHDASDYVRDMRQGRQFSSV
jgi:hypothetical protein